MGIKRYKNAIREIRANGNYLKLLKKPVSAGTVLVLTGRGQEEEDRKSALLNCLEERGISGKIKFASGNKINREILSTAGIIITDDALPDYFIKKDMQNLIMLCDTLMERRKGRSDLANSAGIGAVQRTMLMADEIVADTDLRSQLMEEFMVSGLVAGDAVLYYAGDLTRAENRVVIGKIIADNDSIIKSSTDSEDISSRNKKCVVVAFEGDIKPEVANFINSFGKDVEFLHVRAGGAVGLSEYAFQVLYKNRGMFAAKGGEYYNREHDRLFKFLKLKEINFVSTELFERIEVILRCNCRKVAHRIPMTFYRRLIDVFFKDAKRTEKIFGQFDEQIQYPKDFAIETWQSGFCNGIYAKFQGLKIRIDNENVHLTGGLKIITDDPEATLADKFIIGAVAHPETFEYPMSVGSVSRAAKGGTESTASQIDESNTPNSITETTCSIAVDFPCRDTEGWYINNLPMIQIVSCGQQINVPILISGKKNPLAKKVYNIDATGCAFVLKEDYRQMRFVIREQAVTDRLGERIKLAVAFACHLVTPWNKRVVLNEKYCVNYEESASILFEKLVDDGYKNARFILNKDSMAAKDVPEKYRKYVVDQFSFSHYYNLFAAKSIFSSEALVHSLEKGTASTLFNNFVQDGAKNYVFLQHGVMYMVALSSEQRNFFRKATGKKKQRVVVSSQLEANHFINNTNYEPKDIYNCGLIKFDRSVMNPGADKILVMLTWRPWEFVTGLSHMKETPYYQMLKRIVDAVPLDLRDKLIVMPHPLIVSQADFDSEDEVWKYFKPGAKYDDLLKDTKLLITDYSSISYDAFYRGAGVIFDWEEKDACMKQYGNNGRLMLTEELAFGPVCYNNDELAAAIGETYAAGGVDAAGRPEKYVANYRKIVEHHDGNNAGRFIKMAKKDGLL